MRLTLIPALFSLGLISLPLTGCHHRYDPHVAHLPSKPLSLKQQITAKGAQIIEQGSRLQIVLPTDDFFEPQSTELQDDQVETLGLISVYLKSFLNTHPAAARIYVTGYTDTVFTPKERMRLSRQYAEVIASFLWSHGFSEQQLSIGAYGSDYSIASQRTAGGSQANRRVQIDVLPKS